MINPILPLIQYSINSIFPPSPLYQRTIILINVSIASKSNQSLIKTRHNKAEEMKGRNTHPQL